MVFHERLKHVAVKYHFGRDRIKKGVIRVLKISTACNPADVFTKVLPVYKVKDALQLLRVKTMKDSILVMLASGQGRGKRCWRLI